MPILLTNVSAAGFTATADVAPPRVATEFGVELPGLGILRARVRWTEDSEFGSQFEKPLTEAQMAAF